jgi:hypothetical protein
MEAASRLPRTYPAAAHLLSEWPTIRSKDIAQLFLWSSDEPRRWLVLCSHS